MSENAIGVRILHRLGYRVCHAKNVAMATETLRKVKAGVVKHSDIDKAIAALQHAPLSQHDFIALANKEQEQ